MGLPQPRSSVLSVCGCCYSHVALNSGTVLGSRAEHRSGGDANRTQQRSSAYMRLIGGEERSMTLFTARERLAKLFAMLGSDNANERETARAAHMGAAMLPDLLGLYLDIAQDY